MARSHERHTSAGQALDAALDHIGFQPAVIIFETAEANYG
jgi:hypothetical protein